jgi:hypothetical protein
MSVVTMNTYTRSCNIPFCFNDSLITVWNKNFLLCCAEDEFSWLKCIARVENLDFFGNWNTLAYCEFLWFIFS